MIHRPSVKSKVFVHNVLTLSERNRKFYPRPEKLYWVTHRCRWCKRPYLYSYWLLWPNLCMGCGKYLHDLDVASGIKHDDDIPF